MRALLSAIRRVLAAAMRAMTAPLRWLGGGAPPEPEHPASELADAYLSEAPETREVDPGRPAYLADPDGPIFRAWWWASCVSRGKPAPSLDGVPRRIALWLGSLTREELGLVAAAPSGHLGRHAEAKTAWDQIRGVPHVPSEADWDKRLARQRTLDALREAEGRSGVGGNKNRAARAGGIAKTEILADFAAVTHAEAAAAAQVDALEELIEEAEAAYGGPRRR